MVEMHLLVALLCAQCCVALLSGPSAYTSSVNYRTNALPGHMLVLEGAAPVDFSWGFLPEVRGNNQTAYHVVVTSSDNWSAPFLICDSGVVRSAATLCVQACPSLAQAPPFTLARWKLATAGADGVLGLWEEGAPFVLGGSAADFVAGFVAAPPAAAPPCAPARLRGVSPPLGCTVSQLLSRVVAYIASPGYWQLWSSGVRVDAWKAYGSWPEYTQRSYYDAYDLTNLFAFPGAWTAGVPLGFRLGPGTYCDDQFRGGYNATAVPLLLEIHAELANGTRIVIASGGSGRGALPLSLRAHNDTVVSVDWYKGETVYNDRIAAFAGWDSLDFDDSAWVPAAAYHNLAGRALTPALMNPVGTVTSPGRLPAVGFWDLGNGNFSWKFAQNFAGSVEVTVDATGFANTTLRLFGGELSDGKGGVINQLLVNTQVIWRLAGLKEEVIAPTFVFFGAQYFGVDGWPADMPPPTIGSAKAVATSLLRIGTETLSLKFGGGGGTANATLLAAVQAAIVQSQRANFQSLPSDCPNREKRGWMGDGAVSAWQAAVNFDVAAAYRSWTLSMLDDQARVQQSYPAEYRGDVSSIVPAGIQPLETGDAAWGTAIGEVPFQMLREYGDITWAARIYPGTRAYYLYLCSRIDNSTGIMTSESQCAWSVKHPEHRLTHLHPSSSLCRG